MAKKILVVDDDALMRRSLMFHLQKAGYQTHNVGNAEDALALARREQPNLVLLDIGLPGMDGLEALRYFREELGIPTIFLTARRRELDEVLGLELGADDYITKPFDTSVLLARIKNVLRRLQPLPARNVQKRIEAKDLIIDLAAHTVTVGDKAINLPPRTFDLLVALAQEAGKVVSTNKLLNRVWGAEYEGEPQVIYVHIRWLREKLEENPKYPRRIVTIRGVGYKLVPQEE